MKKYTLAFALLFFALMAQGQNSKWDVSAPSDDWNFKDVSFNTTEGTWMNLDVSPDGSQLVFDMLGDIYTMPISGGKATPLRTGLPFEVQPRFSPDGKWISFTSDAGGGDNIWVMRADGSDARQVTKENFRLLNNAVWTPDGQSLIARKHFTSGRSLGAGEMWMYHLTGGSGIRLTQRKNDQQDVGEPSISKDGKYLYYSEDMYPGGFFQYNKDPNSQIYAIRRYDFESGAIQTVTGGPGGAARAQVSPDGKHLAFIRRVREKTVLYLRDMATAEEWPVYDALDKDQQEAWAIFGVYPNFNWTPDGKELIFWAKGKIQRLNVETLAVNEIPFSVDVNLKIADAVEFKQQVHSEEFKVNVIRQATTSPDGKTLIFNAIGHLWKKDLPNGKPQRLTEGTDLEFEPAFSKDGKTLAFVTWNDEEMGAIHTLDLTARNAKAVKLTQEKAIYRSPSFSPDGSKITYQKEGGNTHQGFTFSQKAGLYWVDSKGGEPHYITNEGAWPQFDQKGERIFYQTGGYLFGSITKLLKSIKPDGTGVKTLVSSRYANRLVPSPDNEWVAFIQLHQVYVAAMPKTGQTVNLDSKSNPYPVAQLSKDAGINLHWSEDSKTVHWTLGDQYFSSKLSDHFGFLEGDLEKKSSVDTVGVSVGLTVKTDNPKGRIALRGARIITMEGDQVIENGTVLIKDNKIEAIGTVDEVRIPGNAKVYDVTGKTIMPGIVDAHAHLGAFRYGLSPQKHWEYFANLAFGVTTTHDPSANSEMVFSQSEMVKAGIMIGPRIYSTGTILYGADGDFKAVINNLEDARSALRRTKAFGAFSVKSYNQPRREQRQQVMQAARELGIMVYPEGGSTFFTNMSMILDGHTGVEHNIPVAPLYKDVLTMWGASSTGYTPTLIVNYGGLNGEYYWYQTSNVWEHERLNAFTPRLLIDARARHRTMVPMKEYDNGHILVSESVKKLSDNGVKVNLGAHGQLQGLGAHWELWMFVQGGMTPLEAIRAATLNGAEYLGMNEEIGSLKVGKLADLIVLDKNPLEDIRNTDSVIYTLINGRMYDASTLNEIGNYDRKRTKFYWENNRYNASFPWHEKVQSFMRPTCSCFGQH